MNENKRNRSGIFGKGYYIALALCAAAIAVTGWLYYRNSQEEDAQLQTPVAEATVSAVQEDPDVPVIATEPDAQVSAAVTEGTQAPEKKPLQTTSPVSGETVFGYSMEALSYNETTRDWRVHNGVDIAAEAGAEVVAAADGEVYTTYEDESLGYTVVIRHEGGYTTKYSSLSEDLSVQAGDQVSMGDVIGTVDSSALVETVLGPHVHFSVTYQDVPMDPAEFLSLG